MAIRVIDYNIINAHICPNSNYSFQSEIIEKTVFLDV
jgi:hypothetical protein